VINLAIVDCIHQERAAFEKVAGTKTRHKGELSSFGSGGVICAVPTVATRIRLK